MITTADLKSTLDRLKLFVASNHGVWKLVASAGNLHIKAPPPKPSKERDSWREAEEMVSELDQILQGAVEDSTDSTIQKSADTPPAPEPAPPPAPPPTIVYVTGRPVPAGTVIPDGYEWFRDRVVRKDRAEFIRLLEHAHRNNPLGLAERGPLAAEMKAFLRRLENQISDPATKRQINRLVNSPEQHLLDNLVQDMRSPCQNTCSMAGHHLYDCKNPGACNHHGCKSVPGGEIGHLIRVPLMVAAEVKRISQAIDVTSISDKYYKIVM